MHHIKIGTLGQTSQAPISKSMEAIRLACHTYFLNCTYVPISESDYGDASENATGTGLVGMIQRGEIDTFEPIFGPTYNRSRAIDFTRPLIYEDVLMVTRPPSTASQKTIDLGILDSLTWQTWVVFISAMVIISIFVTIVARRMLLGFFEYNPRTHWILSVMSTCSGLITQEYTQAYLRLHFASVVLIFWSMAAIVLNSAYTGILFSENMKPPDLLPYKDLESLVACVEAGQCRILRHTMSAMSIQALIAAQRSLGRRLQVTFKDRPIIIKPLQEIPAAILEEQNIYFVWIGGDTSFQKFFKADRNCQFYVQVAPYNDWTAFAFRKGSPLKGILDRAAVLFQEHGILEAFGKRRKPDWKICDHGYFLKRFKLNGFETMYSVFLFLVFGVAAGLIAFVMEHVIRRWKGRIYVMGQE